MSEESSKLGFEGNYDEVVKSFDEMGMQPTLLRGVYGYGFEAPTHIQERAVVPCMSGRDVIAQAQSGMGKTATFAIGLLHQVDATIRECQALVLAPTRELAEQSFDVITALSAHLSIDTMLCIGGSAVREGQRQLAARPHVVVGTAGRVLDLIDRRMLDVSHLRVFVLDEADELLSLGFEEQIENIFRALPYDTSMQTIVVSATMPPEALELTRKFMRPDPIRILMKEASLSLAGIRQFYVQLKEEWKYECLQDIFASVSTTKSIIFVNTKIAAERLATRLTEDDFTVSCIHSDLPAADRRNVLKRFRTTARVLVTTDLLGRGIDVQQVGLVVNYEMPRRGEAYVHRIGRCGRKGRKGVVINLVTEAEARTMAEFIRHYHYDIPEMPENVMRHLDDQTL